MSLSNVLVTTPDYFPRVGGLTTFTENLLKSLDDLDYKYDLFVWDKIKSIQSYHLEKNYEFIINVHFLGGYFLRNKKDFKMINFCHGSEILLTSPSFIKRIYKLLHKRTISKYFENSHRNIAISQFTLDKMQEKIGLTYSPIRDIVINNSIDTSKSKVFLKSLDDEAIKFVCLARDVPHKDISAVITFVEAFSQICERNVELYVTREINTECNNLKIISITNITDNKKEELLKSVHFNLLFSLDHSDQGFYEGFGLTVLEAGKYGVPSIVRPTGGLRESVHNCQTGWLLEEIETKAISDLWFHEIIPNYQKISKNVYNHTLASHSIEYYAKALRGLAFE